MQTPISVKSKNTWKRDGPGSWQVEGAELRSYVAFHS